MISRSEIITLREAKHFARSPYAFPGAYPLLALTSDGACLCSDCVKSEWREICRESFDDTNNGFRVSAIGVNWENPSVYCDHCNAHIASAYLEES